MVRDTPSSQDASTHQIWNSYLKEYRRYGPDTKAGRTDWRTDGRTDWRTDGRTVRLLYASQSSFGGIKIVYWDIKNRIKQIMTCGHWPLQVYNTDGQNWWLKDVWSVKGNLWMHTLYIWGFFVPGLVPFLCAYLSIYIFWLQLSIIYVMAKYWDHAIIMQVSKYYLSNDMWFPTMWCFDKCRFCGACAASF